MHASVPHRDLVQYYSHTVPQYHSTTVHSTYVSHSHTVPQYHSTTVHSTVTHISTCVTCAYMSYMSVLHTCNAVTYNMSHHPTCIHMYYMSHTRTRTRARAREALSDILYCVLRYCGTVVLYDCGTCTVVLWYCGTVCVLCTVVLWYCGTV